MANTFFTQNLLDRAALVIVIGAVKTLLHQRRRLIGTRDFNRDGILQVTAGQALDFWGESSTEQQRGTGLGQVAQDALQIGQKTDVQHAVCLIQHHIFHLIERHVLGFNMVKQAARCRHQYFHTFFQLEGLGLHVHAAKNHHAAQLGVLGIQGDLLCNLVCQLAGGQKHQGTHRMACR